MKKLRDSNPLICVRIKEILKHLDAFPDSPEKQKFQKFLFKKTDKKKGVLSQSSSIYERDATKVLLLFTEITKRQATICASNLLPIVKVLSEGATVEECKIVITDLYLRWKDDPMMNDYIRIETFFRTTKFQGYLDRAQSIGSFYQRLLIERKMNEQIRQQELAIVNKNAE